MFTRLEEQLKINTTPEMIEKIEQQKSELNGQVESAWQECGMMGDNLWGMM
mgnify:CR=1 FL=1